MTWQVHSLGKRESWVYILDLYFITKYHFYKGKNATHSQSTTKGVSATLSTIAQPRFSLFVILYNFWCTDVAIYRRVNIVKYNFVKWQYFVHFNNV